MFGGIDLQYDIPKMRGRGKNRLDFFPKIHPCKWEQCEQFMGYGDGIFQIRAA